MTTHIRRFLTTIAALAVATLLLGGCHDRYGSVTGFGFYGQGYGDDYYDDCDYGYGYGGGLVIGGGYAHHGRRGHRHHRHHHH